MWKGAKKKLHTNFKFGLSTQYYIHNTHTATKRGTESESEREGDKGNMCVSHAFNRLKNIDANKNQYDGDVRGGRRMSKKKKN